MGLLSTKNFNEKFGFALISFKHGSAYVSEDFKKTEKKFPKKCRENFIDFFLEVIFLESAETHFGQSRAKSKNEMLIEIFALESPPPGFWIESS